MPESQICLGMLVGPIFFILNLAQSLHVLKLSSFFFDNCLHQVSLTLFTKLLLSSIDVSLFIRVLNAFHLSNFFVQLGVFSSQVFQESPRDKIWRRKHCILVFFTLNLSPCCFNVLCPCCFNLVVISILAYCSTNLSNGETL